MGGDKMDQRQVLQLLMVVINSHTRVIHLFYRYVAAQHTSCRLAHEVRPRHQHI